MTSSFAITRTLFLFALVGALLAAGIAFRAQQQNSEGLAHASKEGLFWSAVQIEVELSRFAATLGRFAIEREAVTAEQVNERFDILWSRVLIFNAGEVGERLMNLDSAGAVERLFETMQQHEAQIVNIADQSPDTVRQILHDFLRFGDDLRALSIRVIRSEENRLAEVRANVRNSSLLTLAATGAVLVIAVVLVALLLIESRRYRAQAAESVRLAERAEAAARVKSRFLTMMSHELRTPMNGVMGMLALIRQTSLTEAQSRLVEQAQRSGGQMVTLLGDMLDLSDLQAEKQSIGHETFRLADFCRELNGHFAHRVERGGLTLRCETDRHAPARVKGDFPRLRQACCHLLGHLVDIVGSPEIAVHIGHNANQLTIELDAAVNRLEEPGWQPEEMLGRKTGNYGGFASDALAPMIAQGLIEMMGGRIEILRRAPDRASVRISVPVESLPEHPRTALIDARSPTLLAILGALLRADGWKIASASEADGRSPDVIIFSCDGRDEAESALRQRDRHPDARLVSVGAPVNPELFDGTCPVPVTQQGLARAIDDAGLRAQVM